MPEPTSEESGAGIVQALRNLAATLVALLRTRIDLLATEIEEERVRLFQALFLSAGALFFLGLGVLLLSLLIVAAFWDSYRIAAIVVLAAIYLAVGVAMAIGARNRLYARSRLFSASLDELDKDKDQLTPR